VLPGLLLAAARAVRRRAGARVACRVLLPVLLLLLCGVGRLTLSLRVLSPVLMLMLAARQVRLTLADLRMQVALLLLLLLEFARVVALRATCRRMQ
jgi:hypothetical protein